jgi:nucleoside-diphosphate-sugar epimerase
MQSLYDSRILITGASGWIGKETLCLLQKNFGHLSELKLTLMGNSSRVIEIHGEQIQINGISDVESEENFDVILHYAFATQDKAISLGFDKYKEENLALNMVAQHLSSQSPNAKNLILSSGVVSLAPENQRSESMQNYAQLKQDLENRFTDKNSLVLRLWNTSGHHLGYNANYAISEFVSKAKNNQDIEIRNNVRRSYIAAQDVIEASLNYLLSGGSGVVNSGGFETDLSNLAMQVIQVNKSRSNVITLNKSPDTNLDYVSPFTEIPESFWTSTISLVDQVIETSSTVN